MRDRLGVVLASSFAVLLTLASVIALGLGVSLASSWWPAGRGHLVLAAAVEVVVYLAFSRALAGNLRFTALCPFTRPSWQTAVSAVLLGVFLHGPLDFVEAWVQRWAPLPEHVLRERALGLQPEFALERVLLFVLVAGAVPVVEEVFFRGALFARLAPVLGAFGTLLVTSVCFTASHGEPRSWPPLLAVAFVLGVLRQWYGSLWPSVLLHATFNATTLTVVFLSPRGSFERPEPSFLAASIGTLVSAALFHRLWRSPAGARLA
ncbi:MAG TPA: CPBP family intramembrane glutamic endopeptidase [Polyangiaceae bacterium]|nr:CPBP family intramembrane glutamic endopeptidase [Polyangiaceae bacterium]